MKILIVDDEPDIRSLVSRVLSRDGFTVIPASDGQEGLSLARAERPALVVLHLMLPGGDGAGVCRALRTECDVPVLVVSPHADGIEPDTRLALGADGYLRSPFGPAELTERVRSILRGAEARRNAPVCVGRLRLDPATRAAELDGAPLRLRAKEFDLLLSLARHPDEVLNRERLLALAWGYSVAGKTRTVDVHVAHLRGKLAGSGLAIETKRGAGYRLVLAVADTDPTTPHRGSG
jgi:DNA-binding response OmpR family regulator